MKKKLAKLWLKLKAEKLAAARHKPKLIIKLIKWIFLIGVLCVIGAASFVLFVILPTLPDIENIENLVAAQSSAIYDREDNLLYTIHGEENRENVPLAEMSEHAIKAVMAIEDDQFYEHSGVDFLAIAKAACSETGLCKRRGGSTITQQFIKNAFLTNERTYSRKMKEILLALQLEGKFTKDQILEMYLNRIPYGSSIYGIERASKAFFDKSAKDLTLAEGAILAGLPKAPSYYSPYGNNRHAIINLYEEEILKMGITSEQELVDINPDFITKGLLGKTYTYPSDPLPAEEDGDESEDESEEEEGEDEDVEKVSIYVKGRTDFVLARMKELGYINEDDYDEAIKEAELKEFNPFVEEIKAPHFVMYVKQLLEEKYGKEQVEKGGLKITTTLDPTMQTAAEDAVAKYAESNLERYKASNASLVATDPNNGQIMAMVGSIDYWNDEIDGKVNVALRSRLPGSSFKPIVYAAAFLQGYAPSTILYDVKTKFGGWYEPENYDGEYRGPVTMRQALAHSLNVPAVKSGHLAGIPNILDLARNMGIQLNQPNDWYGLSLALGAGEARLLDMVGAYSIFANGGYKMDPVGILKIEDRNGNILEEYEGPQNKTLILDPQVAYLVNNVLSDVEARPEGWWRSTLSIPGHVNGAKTGTSNKEKGEVNYPFDTWTIGYTKSLAGGVWAGNNDGSYLGLKASGLDTAGQMWNAFMVEATKDHPREDFEKPEGIKWVKISEKTGKLPSEHTPEEVIKTGIFASFSVPRDYDSSYQMVDIDKVSGKLATEFTPEAAIEEKAFFEHHAILPDNSNWEEAVRKWAEENDEDEPLPTEYDDVHTADTIKTKPTIVIKSPTSKSTVSAPNIGVWVDVTSKAGINYVEYYWDDELVDTVSKPPYKGTIQITKKGNKKGSTHRIKAIVFDSLYRSRQSSVDVKIGDDNVNPQISIVYPGDGVRLSGGTSMSTQVEAYDPNGDIEKVEFYMDGERKKIVKYPPYLWQFTVPMDEGSHNLKAIAYDYADNKSRETIEIVSKKPDSGSIVTSGNSKITEPTKNKSFDEGGRILIKVALNEEAREGLKEFTVLAKQKGKKSIQVAKVVGDENADAAYVYTFIWDTAPAGTYDLSLKIVLQDGKIRFSERVPIVIR